MVKNKVGGNKAKRFARKNNTIHQDTNRKVRYSADDDEVYGLVNKMIGNGQVIVLCLDHVERLCFIRNKFSGRNKQNNLVKIGSWVLIGKRSWETLKEGKLEKSDLLEIYDEREKHKLIQECGTNLTFLQNEESKIQNINDSATGDSHISFDYSDSNDTETYHTRCENAPKVQQEEQDVSIIDFDDI